MELHKYVQIARSFGISPNVGTENAQGFHFIAICYLRHALLEDLLDLIQQPSLPIGSG
jgi:hypothetical protein